MIVLDVSIDAATDVMAIPAPAEVDLWWQDRREGLFPLTGAERLTTLLSQIDDRHMLIFYDFESDRVAQAIGTPNAMTVEVWVGEVEQAVVARASQPALKRFNIETYSGINHPAAQRELFDSHEASTILWLWITAGHLAADYVGEEPPVSPHHRRRDRTSHS